MTVASDAKMLLLSGSLLGSWWQVVSPFLKWQLMITAAPHSLIHFGAISVNFIMWSVCFTILIEFSLGFLYGDHTFAYSFNETVSLVVVIVRSWWKSVCVCVGGGGGGGGGGADQFRIDLCTGHGSLYLETNGVEGRVVPPFPFGWGAYRSLLILLNSCRAWCAGLPM